METEGDRDEGVGESDVGVENGEVWLLFRVDESEDGVTLDGLFLLTVILYLSLSPWPKKGGGEDAQHTRIADHPTVGHGGASVACKPTRPPDRE